MASPTSRAFAAGTALLCLVAASCAAQRNLPPPLPASTPCPAPATTPTVAPAEPQPTATPGAAEGRARRNVVLIGDSTTYGTIALSTEKRDIRSPYEPAAALEALLALGPAASAGGTPWRGARVHNLGVSASRTDMWLTEPPSFCNSIFVRYRVVKKACERNVAWVKAVPLALDGARIDAVIVDLGINDVQVTQNPAETVARLIEIRDALAPIPVVFFPPIAPPDGPRGDWPQRLRAEMVARGLFAEAQYPPYLPTFDGLHPTNGGYAAKAGLWLDGLRRLP